jgi:hypothetical protein
MAPLPNAFERAVRGSTGSGIIVTEGKKTRESDRHPCLLERALCDDFIFVKAWKGDRWNNLLYRKNAGKFGPLMATAADYVVAEVEELVGVGELDPDPIHSQAFSSTPYFKVRNTRSELNVALRAPVMGRTTAFWQNSPSLLKPAYERGVPNGVYRR